MHKNQPAITRAYRERAKAAGRVQVSVMVPADKVDQLKAFAKQLRDGVPPLQARINELEKYQYDVQYLIETNLWDLPGKLVAAIKSGMKKENTDQTT